MDKNNIIGFVLIAAVLIGFGIWSQPSAEQIAEQQKQDSIENVARAKAENAAKMAAQQKTAQAKAAVEADTTALFCCSAGQRYRRCTEEQERRTDRQH